MLPLISGQYVIDATDVPVFAGLGLFLLALTFFVIRRGTQFEIPPFVSFCLLLFFLTNLASIWWSLNKAAAIYESFKVFFATASILLFYALFENRRLRKQIFQIFVFGAFLVVVFAIGQFFANGQTNGALLGHKNLLASFLVLSTAFALSLFFDSTKKLKSFSALLALVFLTMLLLLRVRASYLALLAGVFCFTISQLFYTKRISKSISLPFILFTVLLLLPLLPGFERFDVLSFGGSDSGVERIKLWKKTWQLLLEKPLFGVGAGNWQFNYQKFGVGDIDAVRNAGITFQRPHNDMLWIASETGLIGFLPVLMVLWYTGVRFHRAQKIQANASTSLLFSALVALLTDSFFSLDKERPLIMLFTAVLFAALLRQLSLPFTLQKAQRYLLLSFLCIGLGFGLFVALFRIRGENETQQLLVSKNKNDLTQMSIHGRKALSVFYSADPTSTPIASYIGYAYERMNRADSMLVFTEQAYNIAPYDYEVLNNYGMMIARAGQLQKAETVLKEAYRINPYFEVTRLNLAVTAYNQKKITEATFWLKTIPDYQKHYPAQTKAIMNSKD